MKNQTERSNIDETEQPRRELVQQINSQVESNDSTNERERLISLHGLGNVWDTQELQERFLVKGFMAPFCLVEERKTGVQGVVEFQHMPRFYFSFMAD